MKGLKEAIPEGEGDTVVGFLGVEFDGVMGAMEAGGHDDPREGLVEAGR